MDESCVPYLVQIVVQCVTTQAVTTSLEVTEKLKIPILLVGVVSHD
jgi:hypothetical protein